MWNLEAGGTAKELSRPSCGGLAATSSVTDRVTLRHLSDEALGEAFRASLRREGVAFVHWLRPLVVLVAAILTGTLVATAREPGTLEFYRAAATVIPTLLLTLSVAGGFFRLSATEKDPMSRALQSIQREVFMGRGAWDRVATIFRLTMQIPFLGASMGGRPGIVLLVLGLGGAEVAALYPLITGTPSIACLSIACGGMAGGFLAIAMVALFGVPVPRPASDDDPDWIQIMFEVQRREDARAEVQRREDARADAQLEDTGDDAAEPPLASS
jgi:hypothetical protein